MAALENSNMPLAGIRVLDLGQYIAGPGASMVLAELGAEVIKIEPPGGERSRSIGDYGKAIMRAYNRGKRSVVINLGTPRGRALVLRLAGRVDVVVQNLRPGAVEKLGLGPEDMRKLHPRLVYLSISGFGSNGPSHRRPGFDIAAQAESGLMSVTGEPDGLPQKAGAPIVDSLAAHLGAQAVLAALFRRERTGQGATLETSLLEAALHMQASTFTDYFSTGVEPQRLGNAQPKNAPAADIVKTKDGFVVLSAYVEDHWARLCEFLGRPELLDDPRFHSNEERVKNRPALRKVLNDALADLSNDECVAKMTQAEIVVGAVKSYAQAVASADAQASGIIVESKDASGCYRTLGLPYTIDRGPRTAAFGPPTAGADTEAILTEAGLSEQEQREMREAGVVA